MAREALRKAVLDDKGLHSTVEYNGIVFEMREPSVADGARIADAQRDGAEMSSMDSYKQLAQIVARCTYDPESGERVFDDSDIEALLEKGRTLMRKLIKALTGLMRDAAAEAGKESGETPSSAVASSSEKH
jgi:hypothetical protein